MISNISIEMAACQSCNHSTVQERKDTDEMACTHCSFVNADSTPTTSLSNTSAAGSSTQPTGSETAPIEVKIEPGSMERKSIKTCFDIIRKLCTLCDLPSDKVTDIENIFLRVLKKYFKSQRQQFKNVLAACCVYSYIKKERLSVLTNIFCHSIGCRPTEFLSVYLKLKKVLCPPEKPLTLQDQVSILLKHMPQNTSDESRNYHSLVKQTVEIMNFLDDCWVVTQHSQEAIIASAFYAWKILDMCRLRYSFDYFYDMMRFRGQREASRAWVYEIMTMLSKLAPHMPLFYRDIINRENVIAFFQEVMEYQQEVLDNFSLAVEIEDDERIKRFKEIRREKIRRRPRPIDDSDFEAECLVAGLMPGAGWELYVRSAEQVETMSRLTGQLH